MPLFLFSLLICLVFFFFFLFLKIGPLLGMDCKVKSSDLQGQVFWYSSPIHKVSPPLQRLVLLILSKRPIKVQRIIQERNGLYFKKGHICSRFKGAKCILIFFKKNSLFIFKRTTHSVCLKIYRLKDFIIF